MRTLVAFGLVAMFMGSASAREIEPSHTNTSLSSAPVRTTSASREHGKREATPPAAKYDVAYPVHDLARATRTRGAI
jgi:hypothetical protein